MCSILSNHLAPSCDIALQLANQERVKHILTGGWWPALTGDGDCKWEQPSAAVRDFLHRRPVLQKLVGWNDPKPLEKGKCISRLVSTDTTTMFAASIRFAPLPKGSKSKIRMGIKLDETKASKAVNLASFDSNIKWTPCTYVVSESQDKCNVGGWVFAKSPLSVSHGSSIHILDVSI